MATLRDVEVPRDQLKQVREFGYNWPPVRRRTYWRWQGGTVRMWGRVEGRDELLAEVARRAPGASIVKP